MRSRLGVIGLLLMALTLHGQVIFILDPLPANTPPSDTIFLSGSFNNWTAGDTAYRFFRDRSDRLSLVLPEDVRPPFEFKVTRGSWDRVETNETGQFVDNRRYAGPGKGDTIFLKVWNWDDLPVNPRYGWLEVVAENLPDNTPPDASIFAVGDFNGWYPGDPAYQLKKQPDGSILVLVPLMKDTTYFKFTRGSWKTIEGRKNGRARSNRSFILSKNPSKRIAARIESWEDLSGNPINLYTFFLLLAAIQSLLLILAINTLQNNNRSANKVLSFLLAALAVALASRVSTYDREIFQWAPSLLLVPDLIYFLYAPLFLRYINNLLRLPSREKPLLQGLHFIPLFGQIAIYLPFFLLPKQELIDAVVNQDLKVFFVWSAGIGLVFNSVYWFLCRRVIRQYEVDSENRHASNPNLAYLKVVMWLKMICLIIWGITFVIGGLGWWMETDLSFLTDKTTDALWVAFALTAFFHGYYTMRQPEIFKLPAPDAPITQQGVEEQEKAASLSGEEMNKIKERLEQVMLNNQPYKNPDLNLTSLAELSGTSPHSLSRVINEGYRVNFNDFVNSYRIREFKRLVQQEKHRSHTLLSMAFDVGFNSKSAFNRSFKKLEQCTPRDYLQRIA